MAFHCHHPIGLTQGNKLSRSVLRLGLSINVPVVATTRHALGDVR